MKIHFDASGRGYNKYGKYYDQINTIIHELGHDNLNQLLDQEALDKFYNGPQKKRAERYKNLLSIISQADIVILEVSEHSLSMGYWLQKALVLNKPVIALHFKGCNASFLSGINSEKLQVIDYSPENLKTLLKEAIEKAAGEQDSRFNFFISPRHQNYLDWIAKHKKIPRSVFLRRLIDQHMSQNSDYSP